MRDGKIGFKQGRRKIVCNGGKIQAGKTYRRHTSGEQKKRQKQAEYTIERTGSRAAKNTAAVHRLQADTSNRPAFLQRGGERVVQDAAVCAVRCISEQVIK